MLGVHLKVPKSSVWSVVQVFGNPICEIITWDFRFGLCFGFWAHLLDYGPFGLLLFVDVC